nr:tRNA (guanine(37)-N(1))-methyltransferase [Chloroflexota bacterium]
VDERVREHLATDELSIGDYVLTGGELAAMVVIDAVARLLPGVLGAEESTGEESHSQGLLEYPHYTRPPEFGGSTVPDILLSGHHAEIARWRRQQSLLRTAHRRPDLLTDEHLDEMRRSGLLAADRTDPPAAETV